MTGKICSVHFPPGNIIKFNPVLLWSLIKSHFLSQTLYFLNKLPLSSPAYQKISFDSGRELWRNQFPIFYLFPE